MCLFDHCKTCQDLQSDAQHVLYESAFICRFQKEKNVLDHLTVSPAKNNKNLKTLG